MMPTNWTADSLLETVRSYQPACVVLAAAELDLFGALTEAPRTTKELAGAIEGDLRATAMLADALVALGLLQKMGESYAAVPGAPELFRDDHPASIVAMLRHQANCLRSWAALAAVVRSGQPAQRAASVRGREADGEAFIEAMQVASREAAPRVVAALGSLSFTHFLDVGGGPGTWTVAFLHRVATARAILYDLPEVLPIAARHLEAAGLGQRVRLVGGDFLEDAALPGPVDLAWVSAIVHQNSRAENRELLTKVHAALVPGGEIMIRDIVMDEAHTSPPAGALFAINMLVNTPGGGTYSLAEITEDLQLAGFAAPVIFRGPRDMDTVLRAARL